MRIGTETPLISLDAVVLDCETTGPDASTAQIIQVGAVRIVDGKLDDGQPLDLYIHPGGPIPPASTEIHGIVDADVVGAPDYAGAWPEIEAFVGPAAVIGHAVGFDLMALKSECERAGIGWRRPRSLDTRILARIIRPTLVNYTLDAVAGWLEIDIKGRHTALGDAQATAEAFVKMIPLLREHGIRTLGEAEQASRAFEDEFEQHRRIGWIEPVVARGEVEHHAGALARIDSYPYRHRVADVMSAPPVFVAAKTPLNDVIKLLVEKNISSVFVRPSRKDGKPGIATERDILRAVAAGLDGKGPKTVADIMSSPLENVREDAFIYRAIGRMSRLGFRHLAVVNDHGEIVGALTSRDLLRQRAEDAITLGDQIETAAGAPALGAAWARLPQVARALMAEDIDPRDVSAVISRELRAFTRRAVEIALETMRADGMGEPPTAYAVLVMGSGGRGESTLKPDQDNGIVFAEGEPGSDTDKWFEELGVRFTDILHEVGIPYCDGGVMGRNADWRHSAQGWKDTIDDWIRKAHEKDICYVDIFYDFYWVHGDKELAADVFDHCYTQAHRSPGFQKLMAAVATDFNAPLTLFGGFQLDGGRLDVKRGALLPIFSGARVLAIRHDVRKRSSLERLQAVRDMGVGAASDFDQVIEAHQVLLRRLLEQQLIDIGNGDAPTNSVDVKRLNKAARSELKDALRAVSIMNTLVGDPMPFG